MVASRLRSTNNPSFIDPNPTLRNHIIDWKEESYQKFQQYEIKNEYFVIKYIPERFLNQVDQSSKRINLYRMRLSSTAGFTWGDALYVAPLTCAFSNAIYGRAGIVGRIDKNEVRLDATYNMALNRNEYHIYDAGDDKGVKLYQEWLQTQKALYQESTMMVNPDIANRYLRNKFRQEFNIDVVFFRPDQYNNRYSDIDDRWFAISDWDVKRLSSTSKFTSQVKILGQENLYTDIVTDCQWTVLVSESFVSDESEIQYQDTIGQASSPIIATVGNRGAVASAILHQYEILRTSRSREPLRSSMYTMEF